MANTPPPLPEPPQRAPVGAPPPAPLDAQTFFWLFFRFDGRISRQVYWLSILFLSAIVGITGPFVIDPETGEVLIQFGPVQGFVYTMASICSATVTVKRLHDLGMSGFFALGLLFFPVAVILSLWVGVRKGDAGPNRFGWHTDVRPTAPPPGASAGGA